VTGDDAAGAGVSGGNAPAAAVRPHAAERALYGLAWYMRRGDQAAADDLVRTLSPDERAEAREVFSVPGVAETLRELPEDELRARMLALAGKSKETQVSDPQREITTRLPGGRGEPLLIVRDHGAWEQQVAEENRAKAAEETRAAVADIERGEQERKYARRPSLAEQKRAMDRIEAEYRRKREEPARAAAQLAALEAWAETARAALPPEPPQPVRYGKPLSPAEVAYEEQQAAWQSKQARQAMAAGCGTCMACRTGGVFPCVRS
jgi:hypothetical protein